MTAPYLVTAAPKEGGGWLELDDKVWITRNVLADAAPVDVRVAHNDPATGKGCHQSGASIGRHAIVSRDPLTLSPSLACGSCSWHGFIRDGKWVPA